MRIIGGRLKGLRLNPPKNLPVRPTTDLAKEALFNILLNKGGIFYIKRIIILPANPVSPPVVQGIMHTVVQRIASTVLPLCHSSITQQERKTNCYD